MASNRTPPGQGSLDALEALERTPFSPTLLPSWYIQTYEVPLPAICGT